MNINFINIWSNKTKKNNNKKNNNNKKKNNKKNKTKKLNTITHISKKFTVWKTPSKYLEKKN